MQKLSTGRFRAIGSILQGCALKQNITLGDVWGAAKEHTTITQPRYTSAQRNELSIAFQPPNCHLGGLGGDASLTLGMSNYNRTQNKLPKILKAINPTKDLIKEIYSQEVFDCIKTEIIKGTPFQRDKQRLERKEARKANIRSERERLKDVLIARYGEDVFKIFNSRNKRKAVRGELNEAEVHALKYWANQRKEKLKQAKRRANRKSRTTRTVYDTYISSKKWEQRRNLFWQNHPKRCEACGTHSFIQLHHMDYEKLGDEPDNHLVALCSVHHADYHSLNGVQRHMIRKTNAYIKEKKEEFSRKALKKEALGTL